jgi:hypothetical protein
VLIQRSSDFIKIKRIVAWQLRFLRNHSLSLKKCVIPLSRWLTAPELRDAQTLLIRVDQEHHFAVEIRFLRKGKPVQVISKLATNNSRRIYKGGHPFIDAPGIILVGGRIQHACLPDDVLQPQATMKRVIRPCFEFKRRDSQPVCPLMGPLPASRNKTHQLPFSHVGIDYFGPSYSEEVRTLKRYGVMFTCLDFRAVHLELADWT